MDAAHYGYLAGATDIIFHPGSYFGNDPAEVLKVAIPRLEGCVKELQKNGDKVTLRPETMGKSAMLGSFEDALAMSKAMDMVQPCLDFAHLHARPGDGTMNTYDEWSRLLEKYGKSLGAKGFEEFAHPSLRHRVWTERGEESSALAEADLDLKALFKAMHAFGCAGASCAKAPSWKRMR
jgi:deoxyribonuclease IV